MSEETNGSAPEVDTDTEAQAQKKARARREMPARVLLKRQDGAWDLVEGVTFPGIVEAERWIDKNGAPNRVYWAISGPTKAQKVKPRLLEEVDI